MLTHAKMVAKKQKYKGWKEEILAEYEKRGRKVSATADALGIPKSTLRGKLFQWGILSRALPDTDSPEAKLKRQSPLPPLPAFNDTWNPEVQVEWLHTWGELAKGVATNG